MQPACLGGGMNSIEGRFVSLKRKNGCKQSESRRIAAFELHLKHPSVRERVHFKGHFHQFGLLIKLNWHLNSVGVISAI